MVAKLIRGPFDGAEFDLKYDDTKEVQLPVPARGARSGYDSVKYFRRSQGVYVWEGLKEMVKK